MAVDLTNFPVVNIVNGLVDFIRYIFRTPGLSPNDWRYSDNPLSSKILIRGGYGSMDIRPGQIPEIIVVRNTFGFSNSTLDNLKSADPNTFSNVEKNDWMVGSVDIICGSRSQNEADCLASFLSVMIHENRHNLIDQLKFLKQISYASIGPSTPGEQQDVEVRRWLTTLRLNTEIKLNWINLEPDDIKFNQLEIYTRQNGNAYDMEHGTIEKNTSKLVDPDADFGTELSHSEHLDEAELTAGWYYVFLDGYTTKFKIAEIVDEHTLKLVYDDKRVDTELDLPEKIEDVPYKIVWNNVHFATTAVVA